MRVAATERTPGRRWEVSLPEGLPADALLGAGLPAPAERHLILAGLAYHREAEALSHLHAAAALAPDHAAILIALYRFHFYKGHLEEALRIARLCLDKAARENGLNADWCHVRPGDAAFDDFAAALPRFFLFSLKGYAYLQMRLGNHAEGQAAVTKLLELDPADRIGAGVLLGILERRDEDDDA